MSWWATRHPVDYVLATSVPSRAVEAVPILSETASDLVFLLSG